MHVWSRLCVQQVDARNIDGSTPLCDACAAGSLECVKLLLEYGATVNPPLFTFSPLHEACMGGERCQCFVVYKCILSYYVSASPDCFALPLLNCQVGCIHLKRN